MASEGADARLHDVGAGYFPRRPHAPPLGPSPKVAPRPPEYRGQNPIGVLALVNNSPSHVRCSVTDDAVASYDPFAAHAKSASSRLNREGSSRKGACPVSRYQDAVPDGHVFRM